MELTIASWNIAGAHPIQSEGLFDYATEDIDYFITQLEAINPDVVCLQETHLNDERSVASEMVKILKEYQCHEVRMSLSHIDADYSLGNAVLLKKTPEAVGSFTYPYPTFPLVLPSGAPAAHYDKGFQLVRYDFGNIINTQMMPLKFLGTPYDSPSGREFAGEMESMLVANAHHPLILCGDLNYGDAEGMYPKLLGGMKSALPAAPTRPHNKKTDYIFYSPEFALLDSGIIETKTDHFLCWAKFLT